MAIVKNNSDLDPQSPYKFGNLTPTPPKSDAVNANPIVNNGVFGTPSASKVEVASSLSTNKLGQATTAPIITDTSGLVKNIQGTYDKYGATAGANEAFVRGAIKASGQAETPELIAQYTGKTLGDVVNGLKIGDKLTGFGVTKPVSNFSETMPINAPDKIDPKTGKAYNADGTPFVGKQKTAVDYLNDIESEANAMTGNIDQAYKDAGVQSKAEEVNRLTGDLTLLDTNETVRGIFNSLTAQDLKDQYENTRVSEINKGADTARNRSIILGNTQDEINQKLQGLSSQDVRDLATYTLNRTNLSQQIQVAQGNYQIASDIAKQSVESMKWAFDQKLKIAQERNQITKDEATMAQSAFDNELSLAKEGMVAIPDTELQKTQANIASGKDKGTIVTNPINGKSYYKPASTELSDIELYSQKKAIDSLYDAGKITESERKEMNEKLKSDTSAVEQANSALTYIDEILNSDRLEAVTGLSAQLPTVRPESVATVTKIDSLKNLLTLQNLSFLKGAMSDKDIAFITSASSALNRKMSTTAFKEEMQKIKDVMVKTKLKSGAYDTLEDYYYELSQSEQQKIDALQKETGIGDEDLLKELRSEAGGFNSVGGDTNKAIVSETIGGKTVKVSQSIADKLLQADKAMFNATGKHLSINQSFRTYDEQAKLYKELSAKGAQVAPAGKSFHETGLAVDVSNWKEAEPYLRKVGLLNNLANDKGHFSYGEFA